VGGFPRRHVLVGGPSSSHFSTRSDLKCDETISGILRFPSARSVEYGPGAATPGQAINVPVFPNATKWPETRQADSDYFEIGRK
jgi:hypothetical protein